MGKIHTHYDNLKVARMAPQEVIRAAYKALSQKYHPDKNPGDEKAARIMAILNSAYGTLSDAQRRKEHDEWIAAEEWEIEWLESTRHEDSREGRDSRDKGRHDGPAQAWSDAVEEPHPHPARRGRRAWLWWGGIGAALLLGWSGGVLMVAEPQMVSSALATAWGGKGDLTAAPAGRAGARGEAISDGWAFSKRQPDDTAKPLPIKVLALSQVVLPAAVPDCDSEEQTLSAPNGESWPGQSGYLDGFTVGNHGDDLQLTLDNGANPSAVFIKIYDMERHANVRYVYVQAHDKLLVDQLASGKYEIRYQNIDLGADQSTCAARRQSATASN